MTHVLVVIRGMGMGMGRGMGMSMGIGMGIGMSRGMGMGRGRGMGMGMGVGTARYCTVNRALGKPRVCLRRRFGFGFGWGRRIAGDTRGPGADALFPHARLRLFLGGAGRLQ